CRRSSSCHNGLDGAYYSGWARGMWRSTSHRARQESRQRHPPSAILCLLALWIGMLLGSIGVAGAQEGPDSDLLKAVGFDQRLDAQVPLDLTFRDEGGAMVRLGDYFGARPVILTLNYYQCPNLCTLVLTKLVETMRGMAFNAGEQFDVVTVSI